MKVRLGGKIHVRVKQVLGVIAARPKADPDSNVGQFSLGQPNQPGIGQEPTWTRPICSDLNF